MSSNEAAFNIEPERTDVPTRPVIWVSPDREFTIDTYPCIMSKLLEEGRIGRFAIEKSTISRGTIVDGYNRQRGKMDQVRCDFDYTVVTLTENGNTWMTDNPFEVESSLGGILFFH